MAIQTVDLTVPGGDTPRSANTKINANFTNTAHAASRLVGTAANNVMPVGAFGWGGSENPVYPATTSIMDIPNGFFRYEGTKATNANIPPAMGGNASCGIKFSGLNSFHAAALFIPYYVAENSIVLRTSYLGGEYQDYAFWHSKNATKDPNGFLKGASPIAEIYSDKMDLNDDAEQQGGITFEKLGVGDYLIKGSLGFAQDGWHIETPKDTNGNVLVAVVETQLENNDLSIKAYAKRFDEETGDIVPNLSKPRDIPDGRFISLRLHELPQEPPVMPTQDTSADAPAQTNI